MPLLQFNLTGRFGNLLFQTAYAFAWCQQSGYDLCLHPWIGEQIFSGLPKVVRPENHTPDLVWNDRLFQCQLDLIYTRKQVREWFKLKPEVEKMLVPARFPNRVCLNVRQGQDYRDAGLVTLSEKCYANAAIRLGFSPGDCRFETDLNPITLPAFPGDLRSSGHCVSAVGLPSFYRLMTAPVLLRANSTFSYWAHVLSENQVVYSPVIRGLPGGVPNVDCQTFLRGNFPAMVDSPDHSDLYLQE